MTCSGPMGGTLGQSILQQQQYHAQLNNQLQNHLGAISNGNWQSGAQAHSGSAGIPGPTFYQGTNLPLPTWNIAGDPSTFTPQQPLERAGIKVGEIIGWRIWFIKGNYLKAFGVDNIWAPGENMEGKVPDYGYEGIWSFKKKGDAIKKFLENSTVALGSIKMWGEVVEHTIGYRAQYAKIVSIDDVSLYIEDKVKKNQLLQNIRENYGLCQSSSSIQKPPDCQTPKEHPSIASQKLSNLLQLRWTKN